MMGWKGRMCKNPPDLMENFCLTLSMWMQWHSGRVLITELFFGAAFLVALYRKVVPATSVGSGSYSTAPPNVASVVHGTPAECWGTVFIRPSTREGMGWGTPDVARMRVRTTPVETYSGRTPAIGEFPKILCWVVYPTQSDTNTKCLPQGLIDDTGFPLNIHLVNWLSWLTDQSRVSNEPASRGSHNLC